MILCPTNLWVQKLMNNGQTDPNNMESRLVVGLEIDDEWNRVSRVVVVDSTQPSGVDVWLPPSGGFRLRFHDLP